MTLPVNLYQIAQIRNVEQAALEFVEEEVLMRRAGQAAFELMLKKYPDVTNITVFCGAGNNGGDGFVLAKLALTSGIMVRVLTVGDYSKLSEVSQLMFDEVSSFDVDLKKFSGVELFDESELIVDALLGIGISGQVKAPYLQAINKINQLNLSVFSLDVPSGFNACLGSICGAAVIADLTLTFIGLKQGLVTGTGKYHCGELHVDNLELDDLLKKQKNNNLLADVKLLHQLIPKAAENAHKGVMGHVVIVGGDEGMPGAVCLAAEGALRVGAGKVTIVTRSNHFQIVMSCRSEFICLIVEDDISALNEVLKTADVCLFGPGMKNSAWSKKLYQACLDFSGPKVVDAGALELLSIAPQYIENAVITPHVGEAARLLSLTTAEIELDRYQASKNLYQQYAEISILKGSGSIIQTSIDRAYVCSLGNPGMATAGMGDVLAGMVAGLIPQCESLTTAALVGVLLHSHAGDLGATKQGQAPLLAGDLFNYFGLAMSRADFEWILTE